MRPSGHPNPALRKAAPTRSRLSRNAALGRPTREKPGNDDATRAMKAMLDGYDTLCRCSPYFHFYFLWALRKVGLEDEALALIKKEWGPMVESGATATWETFGGDERDSLCHPWSSAPFLFLADPSSPAFPSV